MLQYEFKAIKFEALLYWTIVSYRSGFNYYGSIFRVRTNRSKSQKIFSNKINSFLNT